MTTSLDLKRKQRLEFMMCLYEKTDGSEDGLVEVETIAAQIGLSEGETFLLAQYLAKEEMIHLRLRHIVSMTHGGIVEVEAAMRHPDTSTEHFPPLVSLTGNNGNGVGNAAPKATDTVLQRSALSASEFDVLRPFLASLELQLPTLQLSQDEFIELQTDIHTARTQLSSPRPKAAVVAPCMQSLLAMLDEVGRFAWTPEVKAQLPAVRAFVKRLDA